MASTLELLAQAIPQGLNAFQQQQAQQLQNQQAVNQMLRQEAADRLQRQRFEAEKKRLASLEQPLDLQGIDTSSRESAIQGLISRGGLTANQLGKAVSLVQGLPLDPTSRREYEDKVRQETFTHQEKLERERRRYLQEKESKKMSGILPFGFELVPGAQPEQISRKDAQNVKDAYSEAAAADSALKKIKAELQKSGAPGLMPSESKEKIRGLVARAVTALNKSEGLGALAGADLEILKSQIGNVDSLATGFFASTGLRDATDLITRIDNARNDLYAKLDAKSRSIGLMRKRRQQTQDGNVSVGTGVQNINGSQNKVTVNVPKNITQADVDSVFSKAAEEIIKGKNRDEIRDRIRKNVILNLPKGSSRRRIAIKRLREL